MKKYGGSGGGLVAMLLPFRLASWMNVTHRKDAMGGTCLNRGCIPTKAYYRNALAMRDILNCNEFNIQVENASFDMKAARQRKDKIVDNLVSGIEKLLQTNGVEKIIGEANLLDKNHVLVNGQEIETRNILLATGSIPASLPFEGINLPGVINSDQLLEWEEIPAKLAIMWWRL